MQEIKCSSDIKNIFYINLDKRTDRKIHIENQLKLLNWSAHRFPAILHSFGAIGCSLSHLTLLRYARKNKLDHILIMEDDVTFLNPSLLIISFFFKLIPIIYFLKLFIFFCITFNTILNR